MSALAQCGWLCGAIIVAVWLLSVITREYSWTDRIWSIAPIAYLWIFAAGSGFTPRLIMMASLVTLWGARLTFNFWRKGGYRPGGEDYRWRYIRGKVSPPLYQVFNAVFIAGYQNVLILGMTLPAWTASTTGAASGASGALTGWDWLLAAAFLAALLGETVADQQQWAFHRRKAAQVAAGQLPDPFCHTGLYAHSRHPNYFFEQAQWWLIYGFAIVATGQVVHWTVLGAVLITLLFIGSTKITEHISAEKYPEYADYRRRVSAIVPLPTRGESRSAV